MFQQLIAALELKNTTITNDRLCAPHIIPYLVLVINSPMTNKQPKTNAPKTKPIAKPASKSAQPPSQPANNNKQVDPRFARASYDPKFMAPSSKLTKVKIDKRFNKMLKDPEFNATTEIDRYGRKVDKKKGSE